MVEPEHARDCLRILDGPIDYHPYRLAKRNQTDFNDFVIFGLRLSELQLACEIKGHALGDEARAGPEMQDFFPHASGVAGFFAQLTLCCFQFVLAFVDSSGRKLVEKTAGSMPILLFDEHARLTAAVVDCKYDD